MAECSVATEHFILFTNVIFHVLILFCMVSALFVYYISDLTAKAFDGEFIHIVDQSLNPEILKSIIDQRATIDADTLAAILKINTTDPKNKILLDKSVSYLNNLQAPDLTGLGNFFKKLANDYTTHPDPLKKKINEDVNLQIGIVIGGLLLLSILCYALSVYFGNCGFIKHLGIELLVLFTCIGAIEFWFFTNIAKKYIPSNPSVLTNQFKKQMNVLLS